MNWWEALVTGCSIFFDTLKIGVYSFIPGLIEKVQRQMVEDWEREIHLLRADPLGDLRKSIASGETIDWSSVMTAGTFTFTEAVKAMQLMHSTESYIEPYIPPTQLHYTLTMQDEGIVPDEAERDGEKLREEQ